MSIQKATPQAITYGIDDNSQQLVDQVNEIVPAHLPLIYTLAGWGSYDAELVMESTVAKYGSDILDINSPYATHQTILANTLLGVGNPVMLKRVKLPDAKQAHIRISVEVATFLKPVYERDVYGAVVYENTSGATVPIVKEWINGTRLVWHVTERSEKYYLDQFKVHGKGIPITGVRGGDVVGEVPTIYPSKTLSHGSTTLDPNGPIVTLTSTFFPILDLKFIYDGEKGNNYGINLTSATDIDNNEILATSINEYIYNLKVVEYNPKTKRTISIKNKLGDYTNRVVLSNDIYDPRTGEILSIKDVLEQNYDLFEDVYLYKTNLDRVKTMLLEGRQQNGFIIKGENSYLQNSVDMLDVSGIINLLHGTNSNGVEYNTFSVSDSVAFGGISFNDNATIYGYGGSDGMVYDSVGTPNNLENLKLFDEAVREELLHFGSNGYNLLDMAKYPISTLWDTGFALDTKKALASVLSKRRDIYIVFATFSVADYVDVDETEYSRISCAGAISTAFIKANSLSTIYVDEIKHSFPNDKGFLALGNKLLEYGIRLYVIDLDAIGESKLPMDELANPLNDLDALGYKRIYYRDFADNNVDTYRPEKYYGLLFESINVKQELRIRLRPNSESLYPYETTNGETTYQQNVFVGDDLGIDIVNNNRTIGYLDGTPSDVNSSSYQVTFCLAKHVPRAISCVGATPEVIFNIDNTKLYSLEINGEIRAIGVSVSDILQMLNALPNVIARTYINVGE